MHSVSNVFIEKSNNITAPATAATTTIITNYISNNSNNTTLVQYKKLSRH